MKKILIFFLGILIWSSSSSAEILFTSCDLSPNYGVINLSINFEKKQIEIEDESGSSRLLKIDNKSNTVISANGENPQIKELFMIDIKNGIIRITIEPSDKADQTTRDLLKNKQTVTDAICDSLFIFK